MLLILVCRKASCFTVWFLHNSCMTTACQCFEKAMANVKMQLLMLATYCCFFFSLRKQICDLTLLKLTLLYIKKPCIYVCCLCVWVLAGVEGPSHACPLLSQVTALYNASYQLMKLHVKNEERFFSLVILMQNLPQNHISSSWSLWLFFFFSM